MKHHAAVRSAARSRPVPALLALLLPLWLGPAGAAEPAEALRDPTLPPAGLRSEAAASAPGATPPAASADPARHLMVVAGRPYLVERGWLRGVGDRWGDARIERIGPDAVWLREAGGLRRYPLYPGVELRPLPPAPAAKAAQERP